MQVFWFGALELGKRVDIDARLGRIGLFGRTDDDALGIDLSTTPGRLAVITAPESRATTASMPVPTSGALVCTSGTA